MNEEKWNGAYLHAWADLSSNHAYQSHSAWLRLQTDSWPSAGIPPEKHLRMHSDTRDTQTRMITATLTRPSPPPLCQALFKQPSSVIVSFWERCPVTCTQKKKNMAVCEDSINQSDYLQINDVPHVTNVHWMFSTMWRQHIQSASWGTFFLFWIDGSSQLDGFLLEQHLLKTDSRVSC